MCSRASVGLTDFCEFFWWEAGETAYSFFPFSKGPWPLAGSLRWPDFLPPTVPLFPWAPVCEAPGFGGNQWLLSSLEGRHFTPGGGEEDPCREAGSSPAGAQTPRCLTSPPRSGGVAVVVLNGELRVSHSLGGQALLFPGRPPPRPATQTPPRVTPAWAAAQPGRGESAGEIPAGRPPPPGDSSADTYGVGRSAPPGGGREEHPGSPTPISCSQRGEPPGGGGGREESQCQGAVP